MSKAKASHRKDNEMHFDDISADSGSDERSEHHTADERKPTLFERIGRATVTK